MEPTFNDYVNLIYKQFERFVESSPVSQQLGRPYVYAQHGMIVFFMWMQFKQLYEFKAQWRWLTQHPEALAVLKWCQVPHRTTLSRRYKQLYPVLQAFIAYQGATSGDLGPEMSTRHVVEDQSLFKAQGTVWHQKDRKAGHIPDGLRQLDTDATWSKSAYHGWVYGYGIHLTCTTAGFPVLVEVETASFSEKQAIDRKADALLKRLQPLTISGDDAYTQARRIRQWVKQGVIWVVPALRWRTGRYAAAYHRFLKAEPLITQRLQGRKTAIEPVFDLIAKLLGTTGKQKQLLRQQLENVRPHLAWAVFSLQIAMLANSIWGLPFRNISHIKASFA
jgi:hypothetical protein